ncbi:MAG: ATP-binding protein [Solirubrobacterales bacterium]|nr:ATP-binding protein [Solirubrobacterales bacterium]
MPGKSENLSITYEARAESIGAARAAVADFAGAMGASADQLEAIRLVVSEAVTNAVLHAYRGGPGVIEVTAARTGHELWIRISDEGGGLHPAADRRGLGLGLGLIARLADHLSVLPRSCGGIEVRIGLELDGGEPGSGARRPALAGSGAAPAR